MFNLRRGSQVGLLFFLVLFTMAASSGAYWAQWATITIFFFVLLIVDFMFLNDGAFLFDPFYTSYSKLTDPNY